MPTSQTHYPPTHPTATIPRRFETSKSVHHPTPDPPPRCGSVRLGGRNHRPNQNAPLRPDASNWQIRSNAGGSTTTTSDRRCGRRFSVFSPVFCLGTSFLQRFFGTEEHFWIWHANLKLTQVNGSIGMEGLGLDFPVNVFWRASAKEHSTENGTQVSKNHFQGFGCVSFFFNIIPDSHLRQSLVSLQDVLVLLHPSPSLCSLTKLVMRPDLGGKAWEDSLTCGHQGSSSAQNSKIHGLSPNV